MKLTNKNTRTNCQTQSNIISSLVVIHGGNRAIICQELFGERVNHLLQNKTQLNNELGRQKSLLSPEPWSNSTQECSGEKSQHAKI